VPGSRTTAASLPAVPPNAIRDRSARLRGLGRELSLRFRRRFVGRELPVLVLRGVRPDGRLRALSDNFIDLGLDAGAGATAGMENRLVMARVVAATGDDTLAVLVRP